jgi:ribosomal protein S2
VARDDFVEPKLLLICDPKGERQAVVEAGNVGIPTIGLCDTDNVTMFIDWVVPCNNKGRRSLALIFYLLAREYLMARNKIASYDEFTTQLTAFEAERQEEGAAALPEAAGQPAAESIEAAAQEAPSAEPQPQQEAAAESAEAVEEEQEGGAEDKHKAKKSGKKKE